MSTFLGIDIGGSSIKFGWGNGSSLQYFSSIPIKNKELESFKQVAAAVLKTVEQTIGLRSISAIGIGSPGTIDIHTGKLTGINPNLSFWTNINPAELIPNSLSIPIFYDNDANLMALAEAKHYDSSYALGITIGSGIGSGIIIGGKVYHGSHGYAGELGHVCMVPDGIKCNCGRKGCLEAYASVDGMRRSLASADENLETMELADLLTLHNSTVHQYLSEGKAMLETAIVNVVTMLDIDTIILGGGAMDAKMYNLESMRQEIGLLLPVANKGKVRIEQAYYGNRAGVVGAIQLAKQRL
ncbi:MAG: ROK family protein [Candidatus Cloacimonetes bacterium]|nr:ROK family protein [Candidatus Cloacimonadota bacterium]